MKPLWLELIEGEVGQRPCHGRSWRPLEVFGLFSKQDEKAKGTFKQRKDLT